MTMDHLQEALKPHVKAGVLAVDQSSKNRAVGAGAADTKKDAKAMAAITRQNRELTKENTLLKQARPERPKGKGKGSKGGGKGYGKGKSSKGKFKVVCAHPDCSEEMAQALPQDEEYFNCRIPEAIQAVHGCTICRQKVRERWWLCRG